MQMPTVEIVEFKILEGRNESEFLAASDAMMSELKEQDGFISRQLLKGEDGIWMDVVHWDGLTGIQSCYINIFIYFFRFPFGLLFADHHYA